MNDSRTTAADSVPTVPAVSSTPRNPYALALWGLTGVTLLTAFILQKLGPSRAMLDNGQSSWTFDATTLLHYNIAAFTFLVLGVVCLLATLLFQASRWKPAAS